MPQEYAFKDFWKLYKKLPKDLQDSVSSDETANIVNKICERHNVSDGLYEIVDYTGQVLLGVLPPTELQETLEKELEIDKETAKKVVREINRFIFYPVKSSLEELYKIEITPPAQMPVTATPQEKPASPPPGKDTYREAIE